MIIKIFPTGIFGENTYLLVDEETKDAIIIDGGSNFDIINIHSLNGETLLNQYVHVHELYLLVE